jgi:hypothetical protein
MEDGIGIAVFARHGVGPQFLHEKHLVGELRRNTCIIEYGHLKKKGKKEMNRNFILCNFNTGLV